MFAHLLDRYPYETAVAITFTAFAAFQWSNGIQAQKETEPFFKNVRRSFTINPYIYLGLLIGLSLQVAAIYLFPSFFDVVPLEVGHWIYVLVLSMIAFFLVEVIKWAEYLVRRR
jgi:P-type Ca2+ transporter type 2C